MGFRIYTPNLKRYSGDEFALFNVFADFVPQTLVLQHNLKGDLAHNLGAQIGGSDTQMGLIFGRDAIVDCYLFSRIKQEQTEEHNGGFEYKMGTNKCPVLWANTIA